MAVRGAREVPSSSLHSKLDFYVPPSRLNDRSTLADRVGL